MSADEGFGRPGITPPLPKSIWLVAWASLAGQVAVLLEQGGRHLDEGSLLTSVVVGGLLLGYVSAGVVRARTIRLALAWVVLVLAAIGALVAALSVDDLPQATLALLSFATSAVALAGLWSFSQTGWYAWQRTKPPADQGAPISQLVAIGVLVGVLGGLVGSVEDGLDVRITVAPTAESRHRQVLSATR